ncbi:MAG: protein-disulfide reductase DsbD [Marinobacter sp.]|nr:protein-disulfide reductase DsbD [Marinobacter sp.]
MTPTASTSHHPALLRILAALMATLMLALAASPANSFSFGSARGSLGGMNDFLPVDEALPFHAGLYEDGVTLFWDIAPEHYLYRERIKVTPVTEGVELGETGFSQSGEWKDDPYFGEMLVFLQPVEARVPVLLPEGMREAQLRVSYQGCAEAGLCYPPQTREVTFLAGQADSPRSASGTTAPVSSLTAPNTSTATGLAGFLAESSLWAIVGIFFLLGLGLTFTPCVLPMVPIISTVVSSRNTSSHGHALALSISYVLGMALTYAAAGVITGLLGASFNLQAQLQSPWVLGTFAGLFVLFSLAMFNVYDLQLPKGLRDRLNSTSQGMTGGRIASVFGIGALSALVVSPCVSAPLAGSLLYISTTQDALVGGLALFALGLGMGVPLILVAVGGRRMLPSSGPWMDTVKAFYGVLLLAVAIWLLERLVPGWLALVLWGLLAGITGVQMGAFEEAKAGWQRTWKAVGLILFAYALALFAGALSGAQDPLRPLSSFTASAAAPGSNGGQLHAPFVRLTAPEDIRQGLAAAARQEQPVMLDFYADWCVSCKVMERTVFSDREVINQLESLALLQIDMTANTPEQQALLDELGLFGPPSFLFYNRQGEEVREARILGEMNRRQFLTHLDAVRPHL